MAWTPPNTGYTPSNKLTYQLHNEISGNVIYLKVRSDTVDDSIDQGVKQADSPTFVDVVLTGFGAIKSALTTLVSRVNQGVNTTSSPTFAKVNTGQGSTEIYNMNQNIRSTDDVSFKGLTLSSNFLPTTSPIETTTATLTIDDSTIMIPRGLYSDIKLDYFEASNSAGAGYIERLIGGQWDTVFFINVTSNKITGSCQISNGNNLRIRLGISSGTCSVSATLIKS